jgi:hypothetical protein
MSDLPLDETALQAAKTAAREAYEEYDNLVGEGPDQIYAAISTYLRKARFELEMRSKTIGAKSGFSDPEQRVVGPWEQIPVVQAESEEF